MTANLTEGGHPSHGDAEAQISAPTLLQPPSSYELRAELQRAVVNDLLGPVGGPEEEIDEGRVLERYLVGMLAPRQKRVEMEMQESLDGGEDGTEDGTADSSAPQGDTLFPSSFGLTFCVAPEATDLRVTARWGRYRRTESETLTSGKSGSPKKVWRRAPAEGISAPIPLREGPIPPWVVTDEQPDVVVQGHACRHGEEWIVTLFLVNGQEEKKALRDEAWLFQPELIVEAADGSAIFCRRPRHRGPGRLDPVTYAEEQAMAMIYRRHVEFAVGHGVGVHAETAPDDPRRAWRLATQVIPSDEVLKQTPPTSEDNPALAGLALDMREVAETATPDFAVKLGALPAAYAAWIEVERRKIADPAEGLADYAAAAVEAVENCARALARIQDGIALLASDEQAAEAFRFANRAMWLQRTRSLYAEAVRRGHPQEMAAIDIPANRRWYPFQLAFILLNLPSVTHLHHPDRSHPTEAIADLLWFPTGGGKTEAYLGLAAYTIGLRRLQGTVAGRSGEHGVAVLMRYTLRLLTLQQFQRASALICACESIRREAIDRGDTRWGREPFRVGLWVGQRTTPNTTEQSEEAIKQDHGHFQRGSAFAGSGSPEQLTSCPWCGSSITPGKNIKVEAVGSGRGRTAIYCGDALGRCLFSEKQSPGEGVPVLVVDEEIYRRLPALLIATVDKFAQMPWNGATQMLFGQVNGYCPRHGFRSPEIKDEDSHRKTATLPAVQTIATPPLRPPDLIIQDELHLISGPLGTLVGLYETAVDELASWEVDGRRVRPKVIASTATIRRAGDQVHRLFLRQVNVFPPHGTNVGDNFFAVQRAPSERHPGRLYIGICAPGKRLKAALIRVYVAYMAAAQQLYERYGAAADPWMTLVGYFNSMRELGGTRRLVEDDIRSRLSKMDTRGLARRKAPSLEELTSRKGATDIPRVLDRLEIGFDPEDQARRKALREAGRKVDRPNPLDVLLATNMVSVGVDVKRLGLMVVAGQPKATAEYIQATSRVGRSAPGLVCTVFNWARPRDLSHYERFEHYHATFYQHVEALSVTPFAPRALDRGLTALLVTLVRLAEETFNGNERAGALDRHHEVVRRAIETIAMRAEQVEGVRQIGEEVRAMLQHRLDLWLAQAQRPAGGGKLGYRQKNDGVTVPLLASAGRGAWEAFTCLNSLRDVEPSVALILDERGLDPERRAEVAAVAVEAEGLLGDLS